MTPTQPRSAPYLLSTIAVDVEWLDERWQGEPFVPDELLPLVSAAEGT